MHQVDNLFEQQQLRRVCSQPCSNQNAVEFSAGKSARRPVLDGCPRREQTNFNVIAKFSQLFELTGNVGSNEIWRQGTKIRSVSECWINANCKHGFIHDASASKRAVGSVGPKPLLVYPWH